MKINKEKIISGLTIASVLAILSFFVKDSVNNPRAKELRRNRENIANIFKTYQLKSSINVGNRNYEGPGSDVWLKLIDSSGRLLRNAGYNCFKLDKPILRIRCEKPAPYDEGGIALTPLENIGYTLDIRDTKTLEKMAQSKLEQTVVNR